MDTISIAPINPRNTVPNPDNSLFLKPCFREILAREFRLEAIDLSLFTNGYEVRIPAYRKTVAQRQRLIIGAGFDKTGELQLPTDMDYTQCLNILVMQLQKTAIDQLEIRSKQVLPGLVDQADKAELAMVLDEPCATRLMQFSESTRRNIRLPFKRGFHVEIGNQRQQLDDFYTLYLNSMHEHGSLPHSYAFFAELWQQCHRDIRIFVGYMDQQPVATAFLLLSDKEAYGAWSGVHSDYKQHSVFISMLWTITEFCEQQGLQAHNLGRSSVGTGAYSFKQRLANRERKIYYYSLNISRVRQDKPVAQPTLSPAFHSAQQPLKNSTSWLIRNTPPAVMQTLSRHLLHRFY